MPLAANCASIAAALRLIPKRSNTSGEPDNAEMNRCSDSPSSRPWNAAKSRERMVRSCASLVDCLPAKPTPVANAWNVVSERSISNRDAPISLANTFANSRASSAPSLNTALSRRPVNSISFAARTARENPNNAAPPIADRLRPTAFVVRANLFRLACNCLRPRSVSDLSRKTRTYASPALIALLLGIAMLQSKT